MSSKPSASTGTKRGREEGRSRDVNAFSILCEVCSDRHLGFLMAQQQALILEAESERHDNTNNPGKGKGNSTLRFRLLNQVLVGDRSFPDSLKTRFQFDQTASANCSSSKSSRATSLWDAVSKLSARVDTVLRCFEKGMPLVQNCRTRHADMLHQVRHATHKHKSLLYLERALFSETTTTCVQRLQPS
jgi:hypothetical protein